VVDGCVAGGCDGCGAGGCDAGGCDAGGGDAGLLAGSDAGGNKVSSADEISSRIDNAASSVEQEVKNTAVDPKIKTAANKVVTNLVNFLSIHPPLNALSQATAFFSNQPIFRYGYCIIPFFLAKAKKNI